MNLLKFLLSIVLTSGVNLAAIPAVLSVAGPVNWGGIAVAQSVAALAGVFVAFGWGATGPTAVAQRDGPGRGAYVRTSIPARSYLFVIALPVVLGVTVLTAPGLVVVNLLASTAVLTAALAAPWFFTGERAPWRLLLLDTVPRSLGTAAGAVALLLTGSLVLFPAFQLAGSLTAIALTLRSVLTRYRDEAGIDWSFRGATSVLSSQRHGIVVAGAAALYVNLPLILVSVVAPSATAVYAIADKFQKLTIAGFTPLLQVAQGHVGGDRLRLRARVHSVLRAAGLAGIGIGVAFGALLPWAASIFSAGTVVVPFSLSIPLGVATTSICLSAVLGLACLAVLGRMRVVAMSTVVGAAVGVPLVLLGGHLAGAVGVAVAVAVSELVVVVVQVVALRAALNDLDTDGTVITSLP